mmetsp:Transcript_9597/g.11150  ORF Transcript_9597/g.11150 Transcript_9597/m.11150 type:complete len:244 (-) Transcript_9597:78-809(-)
MSSTTVPPLHQAVRPTSAIPVLTRKGPSAALLAASISGGQGTASGILTVIMQAFSDSSFVTTGASPSAREAVTVTFASGTSVIGSAASCGNSCKGNSPPQDTSPYTNEERSRVAEQMGTLPPPAQLYRVTQTGTFRSSVRKSIPTVFVYSFVRLYVKFPSASACTGSGFSVASSSAPKVKEALVAAGSASSPTSNNLVAVVNDTVRVLVSPGGAATSSSAGGASPSSPMFCLFETTAALKQSG